MFFIIDRTGDKGVCMPNPEPTNIVNSEISGIISIDNITYDANQFLKSLVSQGIEIKQFGNSLKVGNQLLSPNTNLPTQNILSQDVIQKQFKQLFTEISLLKSRLNANHNNDLSNKDTNDSIAAQKSSSFNNSNLEELDQSQKTVISTKTLPNDIGESNLKRKWAPQFDINSLDNTNIHPDIKYQTQYYTFGAKPKGKDLKFDQQINPAITQQFSPFYDNNGKKTLSVEDSVDSNKTPLDVLALELFNRIEINNKLVCPECLSKLPVHAMFCSNCGFKVQKRELNLPIKDIDEDVDNP